jgi:putative PEP-CTERM system histidine kinase
LPAALSGAGSGGGPSDNAGFFACAPTPVGASCGREAALESLFVVEPPTNLVTGSSLSTFAAWSYGVALVAYLAFAVRMVLGWRRSTRAALLLAAILATVLWAAAGMAIAAWDTTRLGLVADASETLRYAVWFAFLGNLIGGARSDGTVSPLPRSVVVLVALGLISSVALSSSLPLAQALGVEGVRSEFGLRVGLAVLGLMLVEQLISGAHPQARWALKPLCVALGGIFGLDLLLYSDATLFARLDPDIWTARGLANALVVPFIAIATARNPRWTIEMHVSREVVYRSTALLVSAAFLLAVAAAAYVVLYLGGDWGRTLQIELFFAALLALAVVATSGRFRSKLRVFVSKHFFSYRYDYRQEWLRFTRTLSTESSGHGLQERVIVALADLVESPAGMLWLSDGGGGFRLTARWNMAAVDAVEPADGRLAAFLARTGWVVSVSEIGTPPMQESGLESPPWLAAIRDAWLIVPLPSTPTEILGFIILATPRTAIEVDWEVRDLLKTASSQAASYLGQLRATEALLEAHKFDAFNRMSAFVVHDLKNLVAQLSLMIRNAERHRENPEFQRDMLTTVEHVVERMNGLMLQLRAGTVPVENARPVDLEVLVRRVCAAKAGDQSPIELDLAGGVTAVGHEDRLEHVIGHLVQNAIDATVAGGHVSVRVHRNGGTAVIEVADTGIGMSREFIHERLFKPFQTTKPGGMGIGVYESSQYVAGLGGKITIDSEPERGTRVLVLLPQSDDGLLPTPPVTRVV